MLFNKETTSAIIDYRINILRAHGEEMTKRLINALLREKRNLEGKENA